MPHTSGGQEGAGDRAGDGAAVPGSWGSVLGGTQSDLPLKISQGGDDGRPLSERDVAWGAGTGVGLPPTGSPPSFSAPFFLPAPTPLPTCFPGDNHDAEETEGRLRVSRLWREIDFPPATRPSGSHLTSLSWCSAPLKMQTTFLPPGAVVRAQQVISVTGGGGRAGGCRRRHPPGRGLRAALRPRPGQRLRVQAIGGVRM